MADIREANHEDFQIVKEITQTTIKSVYPKYYPEGTVRFFSEHHSDDRIMDDIIARKVYLLDVEGVPVGTVTVSDNEINRLFVLPEYQHNGYGRQLMDFAEQIICKVSDRIVLDASLPAKKLYLNRGYVATEYNMIETDNGDFLCFDVMEKKRELRLLSEDINDYLKCDPIVNFDNTEVSELANRIYSESETETDFIRKAYEYVRDKISHSADISADSVSCSASEVLSAGHGICFAKSHLLAAILRSKSIPTGFCYQKLILDDETAPVLIYHGLNGVFLREYGKWIRLDARGNKTGVDAQFSIDSEQLAFPIRPEKGEVDSFVIYADPDIEVVKTLQSYDSRENLWDNLPMKLGYEMCL